MHKAQAMPLTEAYRPGDADRPAQLSIGALLRQAAAEHPDRIALIDGDGERNQRRRLRYRDVLDLAERGAHDLLNRFAPGEHLAVWAPNSLDWVIFEFAAALAGFPLVMINPRLTIHEASYILEQSGAVAVFTIETYHNQPMRRRLEEIKGDLAALRAVPLLNEWAAALATEQPARRALPDIAPDATAMIQYTSGTTGKPKGALQTHVGVVNSARKVDERLAIPEGSIWLLVLPLYSVGGSILNILGALWNRGTSVIIPDFDEALILRLIAEERVTFFCAVPTMHIRILEHPDFAATDLGSLQVVICGGSAVSKDLVRKIETAFGADFAMMFGMTEMGGAVCQSGRADSPEKKAHTIGRPLRGIDVKIVDPTSGAIMAIGEPGELCLRGVGLMKEYYRMPEATAAAIDAEGFLKTGDIGTLDGDGFCTITGRLKEMIRRAGMNIYPREIEDVIVTHPGVAEAAAFGIADERWGEEVAISIRAQPGAAPSIGELETFLRERISRPKIPKMWEFVDGFPINAMGKIQKDVLRTEFLARRAAAQTAADG